MKKKPAVNKNSGKPGNPAKGRLEKDIDDLVHSEADEIPKELGEQDPDDLVHQPPKTKPGNIDEALADPDDLVHGIGEGEEE